MAIVEILRVYRGTNEKGSNDAFCLRFPPDIENKMRNEANGLLKSFVLFDGALYEFDSDCSHRREKLIFIADVEHGIKFGLVDIENNFYTLRKCHVCDPFRVCVSDILRRSATVAKT